MRLDLFLKASRLCPRRSLAQELCEAGAVLVNGAPAKSSRTVRAGDEISLRRRNRLLVIRVLALPSARQTSRREAPDLYEIIGDTALSNEPAE
ncbi:MAG TPA: RNA-binding S4 domain-containing protein [Pyrinomonadaceae bacterium]|jgi:ribosomal 50S subunit-recycling heat shock protein|nr:RNA-binding S4 domain-containing protein [Pyrinomonadaceae bacterium]